MSAIPTNHGPMAPEQIVDFLMYSNYAHNRDIGMTAERGVKFYHGGDALEARYQAEQAIAKAAA